MDCDLVCFKVALLVADKQVLEVGLIIESSDGACWELEDHVVLGLIQEEDMRVAIIEAADDDYLMVEMGDGDEARQLFVMQSNGAGL